MKLNCQIKCLYFIAFFPMIQYMFAIKDANKIISRLRFNPKLSSNLLQEEKSYCKVGTHARVALSMSDSKPKLLFAR